MLGGYVVKCIDPAKDTWEYTPSKVLSLWSDISYGKKVQIGVFGGYSQNLDTKDNYLTYYGRGEDIADLFRVSPRIQVSIGKKIVGDVEFTQAKFGTPNRNDKGKVVNTKSVSNIRLQIALTYLF